MKYDSYKIVVSNSLLEFEFDSDGPNGKIRKRIIFKSFEDRPEVFNLGFGDVDAWGKISDTAVSNNKDSQKVMRTVALAVYKFYEEHWDSWIFATGTTKSRTRLYKIGISSHLNEIINDFHVFGFINKVWEPFQRNRDYEAFLIKKKKE